MFYNIKHVCVDFESRRPGLSACYPVNAYLWFVIPSLDKRLQREEGCNIDFIPCPSQLPTLVSRWCQEHTRNAIVHQRPG